MKNREKYAEEIKNYNGTNFCKDFIKPIIHKKENCCSIGCERCAMLTALWLEEEYTEPIIDWSKVYTWYGEEKLDYARILTNAEAEKWDKWKDIEKQGRLIELPCLPDEEVWISNKRFGTHKTMYASRGAIVDTIEAGYAIGYTKEAAEAKLKEMEGAE